MPVPQPQCRLLNEWVCVRASTHQGSPFHSMYCSSHRCWFRVHNGQTAAASDDARKAKFHFDLPATPLQFTRPAVPSSLLSYTMRFVFTRATNPCRCIGESHVKIAGVLCARTHNGVLGPNLRDLRAVIEILCGNGATLRTCSYCDAARFFTNVWIRR